MTDSGKHSALRQTDDGTFELVVESAIDEASGTDPSLDVAAAPAEVARPPSKRVLLFGAVVGVVAIMVVAVMFVTRPDSSAEERELDVVTGFKPYTGNVSATPDVPSAPTRPTPNRPEPSKAVIDALSQIKDDEPTIAEPATEITESEAGWDLSEDEALMEHGDNVVELEPVPMPSDMEGEVVELPEEFPEDEILPDVIDEVPLEEDVGEEPQIDPSQGVIAPQRENLRTMRRRTRGEATPSDNLRPAMLRNLPNRNINIKPSFVPTIRDESAE